MAGAEAEEVKSGFKQVLERVGRLDILVNNAAIRRDGLALRMKADDWEAVIRTNLTGAHLCIQQAIRSEEHTSELQSHLNLVCRLLLEKKKNQRSMCQSLF